MVDSEPYNVLLVCTDQQFAGAMSCAGTEYVETPAMDRLAERGVRFPETYCANPLCSPSRACLFSGEPSHVNGVQHNHEEFADHVHDRTLGHLLSEAGYDCAYGGEWHLPNHEIAAGHGFERICGYNDERLPGAVADYLRRDREDPFFLVAAFDNPHNICEWARNQTLPWGNVDVPPAEECPPLPANFPVPPFEPKPLEEWRGLDMADATPEEWRQYRYAYFRLVERVDDALGDILDTFDDEGLWEDTVVVFTSDHGDMHAAHELQQKHVAYEESVRVPLLVAGPDTASGTTDDRLVSNGYDVLPTICDYAGVDAPSEVRGYSLRAPARGDAPDEWREDLVTQGTHVIPFRMVRTPGYKYVVYDQGRPREQLFDMDRDRGEMVNLAVVAAHEGVLEEHRERLLEWCLETDDQFGSHYAAELDDLPTVPGFEYPEIRERKDRLNENEP